MSSTLWTAEGAGAGTGECGEHTRSHDGVFSEARSLLRSGGYEAAARLLHLELRLRRLLTPGELLGLAGELLLAEDAASRDDAGATDVKLARFIRDGVSGRYAPVLPVLAALSRGRLSWDERVVALGICAARAGDHEVWNVCIARLRSMSAIDETVAALCEGAGAAAAGAPTEHLAIELASRSSSVVTERPVSDLLAEELVAAESWLTRPYCAASEPGTLLQDAVLRDQVACLRDGHEECSVRPEWAALRLVFQYEVLRSDAASLESISPLLRRAGDLPIGPYVPSLVRQLAVSTFDSEGALDALRVLAWHGDDPEMSREDKADLLVQRRLLEVSLGRSEGVASRPFDATYADRRSPTVIAWAVLLEELDQVRGVSDGLLPATELLVGRLRGATDACSRAVVALHDNRGHPGPQQLVVLG